MLNNQKASQLSITRHGNKTTINLTTSEAANKSKIRRKTVQNKYLKRKRSKSRVRVNNTIVTNFGGNLKVQTKNKPQISFQNNGRQGQSNPKSLKSTAALQIQSNRTGSNQITLMVENLPSNYIYHNQVSDLIPNDISLSGIKIGSGVAELSFYHSDMAQRALSNKPLI